MRPTTAAAPLGVVSGGWGLRVPVRCFRSGGRCRCRIGVGWRGCGRGGRRPRARRCAGGCGGPRFRSRRQRGRGIADRTRSVWRTTRAAGRRRRCRRLVYTPAASRWTRRLSGPTGRSSLAGGVGRTTGRLGRRSWPRIGAGGRGAGHRGRPMRGTALDTAGGFGVAVAAGGGCVSDVVVALAGLWGAVPVSAPRRFDWEEARRLRSLGWSYQRIADRLGVSSPSVRLACDERARARMAAARARWRRSGRCPRCWAPATRYAGGVSALCRGCWARRQATSVRDNELRCVDCGEWKPDREFALNRAAPARRGRHPVCRPCGTVRRRREREARKVPCERCGAPVNGDRPNSRAGRNGRRIRLDPNRPYLCRPCSVGRRVEAAQR